MAEEKVVNLLDARSNKVEAGFVPLPSVILKLRTDYNEFANKQLGKMFDSADDLLFARADKAGSSTGQAAYFDAMRELRLSRKSFMASYFSSVSDDFSNLSSANSQPNLAVALDAEELSLVEMDEMEEKVAIETMVTKVRESAEMALEHLHLRIQSLFPNTVVDPDCIPIGPQRVCKSTAGCLSELEMDIRAKLVVLKLLDQFLVAHLPEFYKTANLLLAKHGVMPDLSGALSQGKSVGSPRKVTSNLSSSNPSPASTDGFARVDGSSNQGSNMGSQVISADDTFAALRAAIQPSVGGHAPAATTIGDDLESGEVLRALTLAQSHYTQDQSGSVSHGAVLDFRSVIAAQLGVPQEITHFKAIDNDVINLVSILFEYILGDGQIPDKVRQLIAQLQIPMLKVAMIDKSFFNAKRHPARLLLNEIARASIGWNERLGKGRDQLITKLEGIVEHLTRDFDTDLSVFSQMLEDFEKFVQLEQRRNELISRRIQDAEEGRAKSDEAKKAAETVVAQLLDGRSLPPMLKEVLNDGWTRVLTLHHLKSTDEDNRFDHSRKILEHTLWSISPRPENDARQKLVRMIPKILRALREGLAEVSYSPQNVVKALSELERCHVDALQRLSLPKAEAFKAPVPPVEPTSTAGQAQDVRRSERQSASSVTSDFNALQQDKRFQNEQKRLSGELLEELGFSNTESAARAQDSAQLENLQRSPDSKAQSETPVSPAPATEDSAPQSGSISTISPETVKAWLNKVEHLRVGAWFEYYPEVGDAMKFKLAAVVKSIGKYIFINRNGAKVAEFQKQELAEAFASEQVKLLDDGLIFDRALESIIGSMR
ncbi:MAG: DUF1631 domain-containing protein [Pseudomonadales bacterium]|nr:DUF1631 domain-containing protein [Pseudomonadales bacterium]